MKKFDVVCAGHAVFDVLINGLTESLFNTDGLLKNVEVSTGGDACNESITLAKLGAKTAFAGTLGEDFAGRSIASYLKRNNVNVDSVGFSDKISTTISVVNVMDDGDHRIWSYMGGNNAIHASMIDEQAVLLSKIFNIGSIMPDIGMDFNSLSELLEMAQGQDVITSADSVMMEPVWNREDKTVLKEIVNLIQYLDYFLPSIDECRGLTGEKDPYAGADALHRLGVKNLVIKLGKDGCLVSDYRGKRIIPAIKVPVVDTLGAGDNFVAGFLFGLSKDWPIDQCALLGNCTGAISTQAVGATAGIKGIEQVREFIKAHDLSIQI